MALAGELAKYIGNEVIKTSGKELAKAGAKSTLSSLVPSVATKAVSRSIPVTAGKSLAQAISVGKPEMVDIYRGISAKSDDELADYLRQMIDKSVKPATYGGGSMQGEGYNFSTGRDVAEYFATRAPQKESRAVLHTRVPKNRFIRQNAQIGNRLGDFQLRAESRGIPYENGASARQAEKDMQRYFNRNGLLGIKSNSGETYVINQNDDAWLNNLDVFSASRGRGTRIEPDDNLLSTLRSILPQKKAEPVIDYEIPSSVKEKVGKYIDGVVKSKPTLDAPATNSPGINTKLGRLVDKSGKPITFYHSTPNEFSKFDDTKLGQNTGYTNTALGHFVTTDKDFSKRFIDIDNVGKTGRTMELQAKVSNPIIHPYVAGQKYPQEQLDDILKNWIRAVSDNEETANEIIQDYVNAANETKELMESSGQVYDTKSPLWDEYMNQTFMDTDPYEYSADDREALLRNGYDAVEIVEGPKSGLVDGSNDDSIVSSYAVLKGDNLAPVRHIPVQQDSLVPSIRANWNGAGDIEGMLDGKFLGTNDNYFPSVFSEGALERATYGADQPIDQRKVAGLIRAIKNNEDIAPIAGFKNDDGLIDIYDGHHRLAAYKKAGKMPRVKLFDPANKSDAYSYADEWAKNAAKKVQKYLPAKPEAGLDEYGMGAVDLRELNTPKAQQSLDDNPIILYHGTNATFEDFDEGNPVIWFSDSDKHLDETGMQGSDVRKKINVVKRLLPRGLKLADEDLADNLTKQQLLDRGYVGVYYPNSGPNGDETYYEIFRPYYNKSLEKILDK